MNKALKTFLKDVYKKEVKMVLTRKEIKKIEDFYKKNYEKTNSFKEFLKIDVDIGQKIKDMGNTGFYFEINRQFADKKALQPGTLCECVLAQTIAKMYNLTICADLFHSYIRDIPANIIYCLRDDDNKILARYVYYNPDDRNVFLIQYGNPTSYDADLYINGEIVKIEFKDQISRAGEDEYFFDENGKLIYDKNSEYAPFLEEFNNKTDVMTIMGNNYKYDNISPELEKKVLKKYFDHLQFDVLVSLDDNSELIAVTIDCLNNSNTKIISTEGTEIKIAGKNKYKVFTPDFLDTSILKCGGIIEDNKVSIPISNMKDRYARNKDNTISGKKINPLFFVKIENIKQEDSFYVFNINDVRELKPTFSIHIRFIVSKSVLKQYYDNILE